VVVWAALEVVPWRPWRRLGARLAPQFRRVELRRRMLAGRRARLAPIERKNGWQLAEAAGDRTPDGIRDFLSRMRWDADRVRDDLRAYVVERLGDPGAVLLLDETGFVKKGRRSRTRGAPIMPCAAASRGTGAATSWR
jgi:SRSO17 transposase